LKVGMPPIPMSTQVFSILSALVAERAGLHFDVAHAPVFADKVASRATEAGFESLLDYYYFLRYDADGQRELDALVEALVVGETYLFRELAPLETMISEVIVPLVDSGRRPRIWCAACATGEEPHTVAMLLADRGILADVDLVASDISNLALERARSGRFTKRAVRQEVPTFASALLTIEDRTVTVSPQLTRAIEWRRVNLIDDAAVAALGTFDVVLCRNVLIYFSDETVRQVVGRLSDRLRIGGVLFVGVSESLLRFGTPLSCEERQGVFLYRKVL
jgi:chemotaxis protein methyltransferase CheR